MTHFYVFLRLKTSKDVWRQKILTPSDPSRQVLQKCAQTFSSISKTVGATKEKLKKITENARGAHFGPLWGPNKSFAGYHLYATLSATWSSFQNSKKIENLMKTTNTTRIFPNTLHLVPIGYLASVEHFLWKRKGSLRSPFLFQLKMFFTPESRRLACEKNIFLWRRKGEQSEPFLSQ